MLRALKVRLIFMAVVIGKKSLKWFSIFRRVLSFLDSSAVLSSIEQTTVFSLFQLWKTA